MTISFKITPATVLLVYMLSSYVGNFCMMYYGVGIYNNDPNAEVTYIRDVPEGTGESKEEILQGPWPRARTFSLLSSPIAAPCNLAAVAVAQTTDNTRSTEYSATAVGFSMALAVLGTIILWGGTVAGLAAQHQGKQEG